MVVPISPEGGKGERSSRKSYSYCSVLVHDFLPYSLFDIVGAFTCKQEQTLFKDLRRDNNREEKKSN